MNDNISEFLEKLRYSVVHFFYYKKNGEKREAFGTLNTEIIESVHVRASSKKKRTTTPDFMILYYDIGVTSENDTSDEYGDWRMFHKKNFIGFDPNYI